MVASVSGESFLAPIVERSLTAVAALAAGDSARALSALKAVEKDLPDNPRLKSALASLGDGSPTSAPSPTSTPTPFKEPTAKPTERPTARPEPTRRPTSQPTATPVPRPSGPVAATVPRPIGGQSSRTADTRREETAPAPQPQPDREAAARRLYEQKKSLTGQAYQLYRDRRFQEAKQYIDRAYQIDSSDPSIIKLRNAINERL